MAGDEVSKVSALRERGLRSDACRKAEPQVWLWINSNQEREADTMKTYILRDSHAVEPQIQAAALGHTEKKETPLRHFFPIDAAGLIGVRRLPALLARHARLGQIR